VVRLTARSIDKHAQTLLMPEIELEGWWTSLNNPEDEIVQFYADHGTSEQFHSEFKTDLVIEQSPSGKLARMKVAPKTKCVPGASFARWN
jgi:hypothetical protein